MKLLTFSLLLVCALAKKGYLTKKGDPAYDPNGYVGPVEGGNLRGSDMEKLLEDAEFIDTVMNSNQARQACHDLGMQLPVPMDAYDVGVLARFSRSHNHNKWIFTGLARKSDDGNGPFYNIYTDELSVVEAFSHRPGARCGSIYSRNEREMFDWHCDQDSHANQWRTVCVPGGVRMDYVGQGCCQFNNILYNGNTGIKTTSECMKECMDKETCYGMQTYRWGPGSNNEVDPDELRVCYLFYGVAKPTVFNVSCPGYDFKCYRRPNVDEEEHQCHMPVPNYDSSVLNAVTPKLPVPFVDEADWEFDGAFSGGDGENEFDTVNTGNVEICAEACANMLQCSKYTFENQSGMCKLFSANARGEQVDGSRAGEVVSGFINKKCATDPDAECAVPFTYSVSYYEREVCVFVYGLDPTSTNFHTNFISTIIRLNRNRPEFKILGDSPGQWTSWTDGHILEEEIFTIEQTRTNYWEFTKKVYMRVLCQPKDSSRKRRSAEENMDIITGRLGAANEMFNWMSEGGMALPDNIILTSMENTGANVVISSNPETADGDDQTGQCSTDDGFSGQISCTCADGYVKSVMTGECIEDPLPMVKSNGFINIVVGMYNQFVQNAADGVANKNKKDRQLNVAEKILGKLDVFWGRFMNPKAPNTHLCETMESEIDSGLKRDVIESGTMGDLKVAVQEVIKAKMGTCHYRQSGAHAGQNMGVRWADRFLKIHIRIQRRIEVIEIISQFHNSK